MNTTRTLPRVDADNEHFWRGGQSGALVMLRCGACGYWIHPPSPICTRCQSRDIAPHATSGRGIIYSFTVNHQPWASGDEVPYLIAIVELEDQPGLRLTTTIAAPIPDVAIGLRVAVAFENVEDVYLPYFTLIAPA